MKNVISIFSIIMVFITISCVDGPKTYYLSVSGSDSNNGSISKPWKSLNSANLAKLKPGDVVFFAAGEVFQESWEIEALSGEKGFPIVFTSDENNPATISSGNDLGIKLINSQYVRIENLHFVGSGRLSGNTQPGVYIGNSSDITVYNLDIQGYQKSGLQVLASSNIVAGYINAHNNGFSGILVNGVQGDKLSSRNIHIHDCVATNNPGDPTALTNHSGNGILVGNSTNVLIEYSVATENGWDMPRTGNGPVGIWAYEADSVIIQYCIAYRNKTQKGAADGGGFDLDGGVTNSIIQYCLSYDNEGAGYGLFQYASASPWYNNIIRYNISVNDGAASNALGAIFIWNATDDPEKLKDCFIYNNTIYNETGAAISYEPKSINSGFYFYNNIFIAKADFIEGIESSGTFEANVWHSLSTTTQTPLGTNNLNVLPEFKSHDKYEITDPRKLPFYAAFQLPGTSPLKTGGINLNQRFGWDTGGIDFNGRPALTNGIGACQ